MFSLIGLGFMTQIILLNLQQILTNPIFSLIIIALIFVNLAIFFVLFELNYTIFKSYESKCKDLLNKSLISVEDITHLQVKMLIICLKYTFLVNFI